MKKFIAIYSKYIKQGVIKKIIFNKSKIITPNMQEPTRIGRVSHFFGKISVAVIELEDELKTGDTIRFEGKKESFEQVVDSMEIDRKKVDSASAGQSIGLKTIQPVHVGDLVYKI